MPGNKRSTAKKGPMRNATAITPTPVRSRTADVEVSARRFEFTTISGSVYLVDLDARTVERLGARGFPPRKVVCGIDRFVRGPSIPELGEIYVAFWAGSQHYMTTSKVVEVRPL